MDLHRSHSERGMAFFVVLALTVVSVLLVGTFFTSSLAKTRHVELAAAEASAFYAAESSLSTAVEEIWTIYRNGHPKTRVASLDIIDGKNDPADRFLVATASVYGCTFVTADGRLHAVPGVDVLKA